MKEIKCVFSSEIYKILKRKAYLNAFMIASLPYLFMLVSTIIYKAFGRLFIFTGAEFFRYVDSFYFPLVIGAFMAGSIGEDYTNEAMKQIVSSGIKRNHIVIGQWLAMTVLTSVVTLIISTVLCILCTLVHTFGTGSSVLEIALIPVSEIIFIAVLTAFIQTLMHLTRSSGTTIAMIAVVFVASSFAVSFLAITLNADWIQKYWFANVLGNCVASFDDVSTKMQNMGGSLIYLAALLIAEIEVFRRRRF